MVPREFRKQTTASIWRKNRRESKWPPSTNNQPQLSKSSFILGCSEHFHPSPRAQLKTQSGVLFTILGHWILEILHHYFFNWQETKPGRIEQYCYMVFDIRSLHTGGWVGMMGDSKYPFGSPEALTWLFWPCWASGHQRGLWLRSDQSQHTTVLDKMSDHKEPCSVSCGSLAGEEIGETDTCICMS